MSKSEETNLDDLELNVDLEAGNNDDDAPQYSAAEIRAMDDGWRPQEEWDGDPEEWVSAKEFNFRGELMQRISSQTSQLTDMKKKSDELADALKVLGEHHKKTAEVEHTRILNALKREKAEALADGDAEGVVEIDEKIADLKESVKEIKAEEKEAKADVKEAAAEVPKAVADWLSDEKNAWYHNDPVRQGIANAVSDAYMRSNPEADMIDMLKHVDKVVREEVPHKFEDSKSSGRRTPKVTEAGGGRRVAGKKFTKKDLSDDQLSAAKTFVDMGVFPNIQTYVDELVSNGDLG